VGADLLDLPLRRLLDQLAEPAPIPGGGSAAAFAVSMSAALLTMVARISRAHWQDAGACAAMSEALRRRAAPLAQADAEAYAEVLRLRAAPGDKDEELGRAFLRSADLPLRIAEIGADVAELAAIAADRVEPRVRGDAAAAALLAESGTRVAAHLVAINLAAATDDARTQRASTYADAAAQAARRAAAVEM
jgi:glutamate formiminotransferase/formiminotetrahydrofolate cyclodeaminase